MRMVRIDVVENAQESELLNYFRFVNEAEREKIVTHLRERVLKIETSIAVNNPQA